MGFLRRYAFLSALAIIVTLFTIAVNSGNDIYVAYSGVLTALVLCAVVIFFEEDSD